MVNPSASPLLAARNLRREAAAPQSAVRSLRAINDPPFQLLRIPTDSDYWRRIDEPIEICKVVIGFSVHNDSSYQAGFGLASVPS
jgi:hypothetical protein